MEVRKAIKKMVALGTGLAMVGATIFGAAAADLSDYPSPMFIDDGKFNGVIVVGDSAASSDVIGSVDIATSLQYASTTVTEVSVGDAVTPTVSQGVRIAKSGNELNIGQSLDEIEDKFDDVDLPDILPDGLFEDEDGGEEDYTQELELGVDGAILMFYQDDEDAPEAGVCLHIEEDAPTYTFTLELDDSISGTNDTQSEVEELLESATIEIQGNVYTITKVEKDDTGITSMTLQAGEATIWLEEEVEVTKIVAGVSHTVVLQDVNEDETKCGIEVDGTLAWVDKGKTKTVNGVDIGVTDAIVVHSAGKDTDVCEVNLGAAQLELESGKDVNVNGADIDGSEVTILKDAAGEWEGLTIVYEADEDAYLGAGDTWVDPVLGNFELKYAGLTKVTEKIEVDTTGSDDAELKFTNNDGKIVEVPFNYNETYIILGEDSDKLVLRDGDTCTGATDAEDCEGFFIWVVSSNGEAHMLQIDDLDEDEDEIVLDDKTYDKTYTDDLLFTTPGVPQVISLGSFKDINITLDNPTSNASLPMTTLTVETTEEALAETKLGAEINFTNETINIVEDPSTVETDVTLQVINVSLTYASGDEEIQIGAIQSSVSLKEKEPDSDTEVGYTEYGTMIETDTEDDNYVDIVYPEEAAYGNVFISPVGAEISETMGGAMVSTVVQKIQVGAAKLASEVSNINSVNAIVVGGPCANAAASTLMGNPEQCWAAIPENKAIIKLYESGSRVALLVAGRSALDTRRACRVLANFDDYDLSGMEVEVTGTSLTDISVSAPQ